MRQPTRELEPQEFQILKLAYEDLNVHPELKKKRKNRQTRGMDKEGVVYI